MNAHMFVSKSGNIVINTAEIESAVIACEFDECSEQDVKTNMVVMKSGRKLDLDDGTFHDLVDFIAKTCF